MRRIAIIGCGGSGKTTVGRRLAAYIDASVTHLDAVYYDADWKPLPPKEFAEIQEKLAAEPQWVIDGNFASTLPIRLANADTVVFLDIPPLVCLWGILQRRLKYRGGQHTEQGVYDRIHWASSATSSATGARCGPRSAPSSPSTPPMPASSL